MKQNTQSYLLLLGLVLAVEDVCHDSKQYCAQDREHHCDDDHCRVAVVVIFCVNEMKTVLKMVRSMKKKKMKKKRRRKKKTKKKKKKKKNHGSTNNNS